MYKISGSNYFTNREIRISMGKFLEKRRMPRYYSLRQFLLGGKRKTEDVLRPIQILPRREKRESKLCMKSIIQAH